MTGFVISFGKSAANTFKADNAGKVNGDTGTDTKTVAAAPLLTNVSCVNTAA